MIRRGSSPNLRLGWWPIFRPGELPVLLECGNARSKSGGPNTANFCNGEFDRLYREMKDMPSNEARAGLIRRMLAILEWERPWIELYR
jgi:ABC-type transport system substrate-binding protein